MICGKKKRIHEIYPGMVISFIHFIKHYFCFWDARIYFSMNEYHLIILHIITKKNEIKENQYRKKAFSNEQ